MPYAPPNAPILGAFMEISNHSDGNIKLLSANTSNTNLMTTESPSLGTFLG
jgi:copper(I)-binding protein